MFTKVTFVSALILATLVALAALHMQNTPSMQSPAVFLEESIENGDTPAIQYRHFGRDSVLFQYDGGFADIARNRPVSNETIYHGFSVTKTFTALAILQLAEEGKIALNGSVASYLPDVPYPKEITVLHLLTHSAGIPNPIPLSWIHLEEEHSTFDRDAFFARQFASNPKVKARPNERFAYSNLGYVLLGRLIEKASGLKYEQYITDRILTPLGMGTGELGFDVVGPNHAIGYHKRMSLSYVMLGFFLDKSRYVAQAEDGWMAFRPYHVNGTPYGGLTGTADGFMRYVQAILQPANGLISEEAKQLMFAENILNNGTSSGMALAWFRGEVEGRTYYAHAGGGGGFYMEMRIYPELDRGSVIMFNRSGMSDKQFLDQVDRLALRMEGQGGAARAFAQSI